MNTSEIHKRARLLAGDSDAIDENQECEINVSSESDDEISTNRLRRHARLVYSNSDDENETISAESNQEENGANSVEHSKSPIAHISSDPLDGFEKTTANEFNSEDFNSQRIRERLADLGDSEPMDDVAEMNSKSNKRNRFSMSGDDSLSGSDDDDIGLISSFRKKKAKILDDDDDDE